VGPAVRGGRREVREGAYHGEARVGYHGRSILMEREVEIHKLGGKENTGENGGGGRKLGFLF